MHVPAQGKCPAAPPVITSASCKQFAHDACRVDVSQSFIAAVQMVRDALVIQPQLMQDRRMQVGDHGAFIDSVIAEFIRGAISLTTANAAAGHPEAEALLVMIAPVARLADRRAAEFT